MQEDAAEKGWNGAELAKLAGVTRITASRFFRNDVQTPRIAKKFAQLLGYPLSRYLIRRRRASRGGVAA